MTIKDVLIIAGITGGVITGAVVGIVGGAMGIAGAATVLRIIIGG